MDTSETYVKMCDCREIQDEWIAPPNEWDFAIQKIGDELSNEKVLVCEMEYFIWLPRQDQIQEMVGCFPGNHVSSMDKFVKAEYFHSLEQKWLAFYMHEKHKKTWTGEEWK